MAVAIKEKRIEFRVLVKEKKTIEDAARLSNISLSSYILSVVLKQPKIVLEQNETIVLNNVERNSLMKALECLPKPNKALKDLFR